MLNEMDYRTLYPLVKGFVIKYECGGIPENLDDDVFHETCLKVLKLMRGKPEYMGISFETIEKYVCKSYRVNCKREKMYFRNCKEKTFGDFGGFECPEENFLDNESILTEVGKDVAEMFGEELHKLFAKHVYAKISIRELEEESGRKNLKYAFSKIKEFLRNDQRILEMYGLENK